MNNLSVRQLVNYLISCLSNKILYFVIMAPVILTGTRIFVFNVLDVCGMPVKASFAVSDMVLFFIVALIFFTLIDGCIPVPDFIATPENFEGFMETIRCTGLY